MVDIDSQKQREIFETYVIRLLDELTFIDSCFELWFHISNKQVDKVEELNIAPAFFTVVKKYNEPIKQDRQNGSNKLE